MRKISRLWMLVFFIVIVGLYLTGCASDPEKWRIIQKNNKVTVINNNKKQVFLIGRKIYQTYRVFIIATNPKLNVDSGAFANVWVMPLDKILEAQTFLDLSEKDGQRFCLIPANSFVQKDILNIAKDSKRWEKVNVVGSLLTKIEEDGKPPKSNLPYLYVHEFKN